MFCTPRYCTKGVCIRISFTEYIIYWATGTHNIHCPTKSPTNSPTMLAGFIDEFGAVLICKGNKIKVKLSQEGFILIWADTKQFKFWFPDPNRTCTLKPYSPEMPFKLVWRKSPSISFLECLNRMDTQFGLSQFIALWTHISPPKPEATPSPELTVWPRVPMWILLLVPEELDIDCQCNVGQISVYSTSKKQMDSQHLLDCGQNEEFAIC